MNITTNYDLGDIVYLKTDKDQAERLITEIKITGDGGLVYGMNCGITNSFHYEMEFSKDKDILTTLQ